MQPCAVTCTLGSSEVGFVVHVVADELDTGIQSNDATFAQSAAVQSVFGSGKCIGPVLVAVSRVRSGDGFACGHRRDQQQVLMPHASLCGRRAWLVPRHPGIHTIVEIGSKKLSPLNGERLVASVLATGVGMLDCENRRAAALLDDTEDRSEIGRGGWQQEGPVRVKIGLNQCVSRPQFHSILGSELTEDRFGGLHP